MLSTVAEAGSAHRFEQRLPHFRGWAEPARHIPGKLGAANRTEAAAGPRQLGLIPSPGHAAGQGKDDDGGPWYVLRPSGQIVVSR
jgi:hypothetical protein